MAAVSTIPGGNVAIRKTSLTLLRRFLASVRSGFSSGAPLPHWSHSAAIAGVKMSSNIQVKAPLSAVGTTRKRAASYLRGVASTGRYGLLRGPVDHAMRRGPPTFRSAGGLTPIKV